MRRSISSRALSAVFRRVNRRVAWHKLPLPLSVLNLAVLRNDLRDLNLHDTVAPDAERTLPPPTPEVLTARTPDGTWNDLSNPEMGSVGFRFGRNFPLHRTVPDSAQSLYDPNPREISDRLLARDTFKPASILNVIAAAWLQFENHNWFFHGKGYVDEFLEIQLPPGDDWPEPVMRIRRSIPQSSATGRGGPTYANTMSHWWDGSQVYGTGEKQRALRLGRDGKLKVQDDGRLLPDPDIPGIDHTGFNDNYWVGLSLLHTLFTLEHNAICDRLRNAYPSLSDQRLFEIAWLTNAALMAKIHTVEWTCAILPNPALQIGMHANWWGALGERVKKRYGRLGESEAFCGIVGSTTNHHGVPFSLTEEFIAVYRMHPLIPDDWTFRSLSTGDVLEQRTFTEIQGDETRRVIDRIPMADIAYSLGIANPGAVTLRNYPNALRRHRRLDGELLDLASLDVIRDRERGVPRYNDFREMLRMPRVRSFEEFSDDANLAAEIKDVYRGDIDRVDPIVGMFAETPPRGFGFSDTAFRIFILMASRRLKSDRFFTTDFTPEVYTKVGIDWVNEYGMKDVLLRHHPSLARVLESVSNPFAPWPRVPVSAGGAAGNGRSADASGVHATADTAAVSG